MELGVVEVVSRIDKCGRTLAFTSVSFYGLPKGVSMDDTDDLEEYVIAKARHTKYLVNPKM